MVFVQAQMWSAGIFNRWKKHVLRVFLTASKISLGLQNYTLYANKVLQIHCATEYKRLPLVSIPTQYGSIKGKKFAGGEFR